MARVRALLHYLIPLAMLGLALVLRIFVPAVEEVQLKVFDSFQRFSPRVYEPAPVRIIDLDDASLEKIGQWP